MKRFLFYVLLISPISYGLGQPLQLYLGCKNALNYDHTNAQTRNYRLLYSLENCELSVDSLDDRNLALIPHTPGPASLLVYGQTGEEPQPLDTLEVEVVPVPAPRYVLLVDGKPYHDPTQPIAIKKGQQLALGILPDAVFATDYPLEKRYFLREIEVTALYKKKNEYRTVHTGREEQLPIPNLESLHDPEQNGAPRGYRIRATQIARMNYRGQLQNSTAGMLVPFEIMVE